MRWKESNYNTSTIFMLGRKNYVVWPNNTTSSIEQKSWNLNFLKKKDVQDTKLVASISCIIFVREVYETPHIPWEKIHGTSSCMSSLSPREEKWLCKTELEVKVGEESPLEMILLFSKLPSGSSPWPSILWEFCKSWDPSGTIMEAACGVQIHMGLEMLIDKAIPW